MSDRIEQLSEPHSDTHKHLSDWHAYFKHWEGVYRALLEQYDEAACAPQGKLTGSPTHLSPMTLSPRGAVPFASPGSLRSYSLSEAFERYLKDRAGQEIQFSLVVEGLRLGGVVEGEKSLEQRLKTIIKMRPDLVQSRPVAPLGGIKAADILVWLNPTANEPKPPAQYPKRGWPTGKARVPREVSVESQKLLDQIIAMRKQRPQPSIRAMAKKLDRSPARIHQIKRDAKKRGAWPDGL